MNYTCPYCNQATTITSPNIAAEWSAIDLASKRLAIGRTVGINYTAITCPNESCKQLSLSVELTGSYQEAYTNQYRQGDTLQHWQLLPESNAKPQPNYIPKAIVADYIEACRIKDLSPKASATLARRCIQGMIRDFWGIKKNRLVDEIAALEGEVSAEVWDSLEAVRSVGNIGAHMEKDVNVIVDIEPGEADLLINLIEELLDDWYVTRHSRQERHRKIQEMAEAKKAVSKPKAA